jgi:glycosyltransferase involved in cell wall biosynthesis
MKIAFLCPIKRPILPDTTVSRNRVIVDLANGLMQKGHQVTLFATQDSVLPGAQIIGILPKGLNFLAETENPFYQHTSYLTQMIAESIARQGDFDLIHNHMYPEYLALLSLSALKIPMITTVHSQMVPETVATLKKFPSAHLVAISESAKNLAGMTNLTVVHNSVDTDLFVSIDGPKDYLLAVGRMSKAKDETGNFLDPKGIGNAIKIAESTQEKLKIVGNCEDPQFFESIVKPHLSDKIEFVGKVSAEQTLTRPEMVKLFQNAKAFINPINWQEPFGLVMAESLSCGTPVIAYNRGAVREIVVDSKVGFIIENPNDKLQMSNQIQNSNYSIKETGIEGMCEAVKRIGEIDRKTCRDHAVANFSKNVMVDSYEKIYNQLTSANPV